MKRLLVLLALSGPALAAPQNVAPPIGPSAALPPGHVPVAAAQADIPLTRKGKVLEVVDSPMYTYLRVSGDKEPVWLAAYKNNIAKGAAVNYSDGVVMSNFHSKTLNRTFEAIMFVDRVETEIK
jgi:hypothetical protein